MDRLQAGAQELIDAFVQAFDPELWAAPLIVMFVGLIAGIALATWRTSTDAAEMDAESKRMDLERRRDAVIEAVRALDMERDKLSDEDYERQRRALLAHGAEAMRALEEGDVSEELPEGLIESIEAQTERLGVERVAAIRALLAGGDLPEAKVPEPAPPPAARISPRWEGALWTLGAVGVLVAIFLVLGFMDNSGQLPEVPTAMQQQPGPPPPSRPPPIEAGEQETAWMASLKANPRDLAALNGLTDFEIRRQGWPAAEGYNVRALAVNAADPEARTWKALLAYRAGSYADAIAELDGVIADVPAYGRAHQFRGIVHLQLGELEPAIERFERALALAEDDRTRFGLRQLIAEARNGLAGGGAPEAPAPAAGAPDLAGTITLAPGVDPASWGPRASVYVSVRAATGPPMPLRAKRFPVDAFPLKWDLHTTDAPMRGGPLPDTVVVTVKVDLDGNAMGDDPGAPKVVVEGIRAGATDVALVLGG